MKRILSLVLVLVLAFGSMPVFAADVEYGAWLQDAGLLQGDAEGNLNASSALTRAEMMVVLSRLLGVEEEAQAFALASTFTDAEGHWASAYIAYAEANGWSNGMGDGTFGADKALSAEEASTFLLRALGYSPVWGEAVADANALGINAIVSDNGSVSRGEVFELMYDTVMTAPMGSDVILGETLGVVAPVVVVVDEMSLVSNYALGQLQVVTNYSLELVDLDEMVVTVAGSELTLGVYNTNDYHYVLSDDFMTVDIYLHTEAAQEADVEVVIEEMTAAGMMTDVVKPALVTAEMTSSKTMEVMFTEDLDETSGQAKVWDNILVDEAKAVGTFAQDDTNLNKWVFTFNTSLESGRHDVEISDFLDNAGFGIPTFAGFVTVLEDIDAPYVVAVDYVSTTEVTVTFNEPVVAGTVTLGASSDGTIPVGPSETYDYTLDVALDAGDTYGIDLVFTSVEDVEGNISSADGITFAWEAPYETAKPTVVLALEDANVLRATFSEIVTGAVYALEDADEAAYAFVSATADADTDAEDYLLVFTGFNDGTTIDPADFTLTVNSAIDGSIIGNEMTETTLTFTALDSKLPTISGVKLVDATVDAEVVRITFSEAMDASTIGDLEQYIYNGDLLSNLENSAAVVAVDASSVDLTIPGVGADAADNGGIAWLNIKDIAGNKAVGFNSLTNVDPAGTFTEADFQAANVVATGLRTIVITPDSEFIAVTANNFKVYQAQTVATLSTTHYVTSAVLGSDVDGNQIVTLSLNADLTYTGLAGALNVFIDVVDDTTQDTFNNYLVIDDAARLVALDGIAPVVTDVAQTTGGQLTITFSETLGGASIALADRDILVTGADSGAVDLIGNVNVVGDTIVIDGLAIDTYEIQILGRYIEDVNSNVFGGTTETDVDVVAWPII